jgi:uncharacterized protein (TIGR02246 family)
MRPIIFFINLLALLSTSLSQVSAKEAAERAAIQAVLDAHGNAWTKGDAAAATEILTEDADWVGASGIVLHGRQQIRAAHEQWLKEAKGSRHSHPGTSIRFLRPDVALVDGDSYMAGLRDAKGKEMPAEVNRYSAIFVKQGGRWLVTAFRSLPQVKVEQPKQ